MFSTSFGSVMSTTKVNRHIFQLFPYGPNNYIGFGTTIDRNTVALVLFSVSYSKLTFMQSLTLNSSYSYSSYGWYSSQFLQFDWERKRITFPLFSA